MSSSQSKSSTVKVIDALGWVYVQGGHLLCARSHHKDAFYLPGGKREPGESDWEAIAREVREEMSLTLDPDSLSLFSIIEAPAHGHGPTARVVLRCYECGFHGEIHPAAEIEEIAWLGYGERDRCAPATAIVLEQLHQQGRLNR